MSILGNIEYADASKDRQIELLRRELAEARNQTQQVILEAGWAGLKIEMVPEKIIPAIVEPAHISVRKVRK